jgi:hypothetical protein
MVLAGGAKIRQKASKCKCSTVWWCDVMWCGVVNLRWLDEFEVPSF